MPSFKAFTGDLHRLADWLAACKIKSVALESTGVYWIPIFEILEERGFEVVLVNSRHIKNVPGRKTDVLDCQWIQQLHSVGLLRGSFRPAAEIASLRAYLRHRDKLVQSAAAHVQRMQKALVQMNLQLHNVISPIVATILGVVMGLGSSEISNWRRDRKSKKRKINSTRTLIFLENERNMELLKDFWYKLNKEEEYEFVEEESKINMAHRLIKTPMPSWNEIMWRNQASLLAITF